MVVVQDELQNHCRSRETCSFGTPDAVVCKAARSASAVLAAVGPSVGIGARAGAGFHSFPGDGVNPGFDPGTSTLLTARSTDFPVPVADEGGGVEKRVGSVCFFITVHH